MDRRFVIVIGVAAAGAMALGAQTATSSTVGPVDTTPPDLQLSGLKHQRVVRIRPADVKIEMTCGDEECTAYLNNGKLTNVKEDTLTPVCRFFCYGEHDYSPVVIPPGETGTGIWALTRLQITQVRKAIFDEGKNVQAKVSVEATDAAGNVATAKRTIRLCRGRSRSSCRHPGDPQPGH
jgi:hypothetical protein